MHFDIELVRNEVGALLLRALSAEAERNKLLKQVEEMSTELNSIKESLPKS